jgi:signal transduction histidine kinase
MTTTPQPNADSSNNELHNEVIRLNKIITALIKHADAQNAEKQTDFGLFQTQVMLEDQVSSRTEQLENALLENKQINAMLIKVQQQMTNEIEERKLVLIALEKEKNEQKALIKKLEDSDRQLRESEKLSSIGQLAAGVAHEINNPMGYITSNLTSIRRYFLQLLQIIALYEDAIDDSVSALKTRSIQEFKDKIDLEFLKEDIGPLLQDSIVGATKVRKIVQDLLLFSRVGENSWEWVNIHDGLDSTLNILNNELKYKADIIKEYGHIPTIRCLPAQLNQVFMNILLNAAHAIDIHGEIRLKTAHENGWIYIAITDTGDGMTPEVKSRIFDPFFTTKRLGTGTGMGLSVSYGIIQKHQGRIEVESVLGQGSTFTIWLPVSPS